jgi:hypothetical protein
LHGGIADLTVGLARAPANASAWLELAQAHLAIGVAPAALADLDASLAFGRFDPALNLRRAEVALRLWLILQEKDRAMLKEQLRFAWNQDPEKLIELAARDPWTAQTIRSFFAGDSQDITEFDRLLARHVRDAKKAP